MWSPPPGWLSAIARWAANATSEPKHPQAKGNLYDENDHVGGRHPRSAQAGKDQNSASDDENQNRKANDLAKLPPDDREQGYPIRGGTNLIKRWIEDNRVKEAAADPGNRGHGMGPEDNDLKRTGQVHNDA